MDQAIEFLKEMGALIAIIGTLAGSIYAGATALTRAISAKKSVEAKAKIAQEEQDQKNKASDVDLTERLNAGSDKVIASLEARFVRLEAELLAEKRKAHRYRTAGLKAIEAIQATLSIRAASPHADHCEACLAQDRILLERMSEIRNLLDKESE